MNNLASKSRLWHYLKKSVSSPLVRSCLVMTVSLCSTFIGYEYARAASITLLAAKVFLNLIIALAILLQLLLIL